MKPNSSQIRWGLSDKIAKFVIALYFAWVKQARTKIAVPLLFVILFFVLGSWMHPFYVGVSHIRISQNQTEAQIEVRLFTDDIQQSLKDRGLNFDPRKRDSSTMRKLQKIFNQELALFAKNKAQHWDKLPLSLIGFEEESEATWFYLEVPKLPAKVTAWRFQNTLLFKEHPEQVHVVHAEIGPNYRKSEQLNIKRSVFEF